MLIGVNMENTGFNSFDIGVAVVLLLSGLFALRRGLVGEIMSLGTWIIATVFTFAFFPIARPLMEGKIENELLADASTGLGLFCLALIVLIPIGNMFNESFKGPTFSSIDRSLGFVFGLVRGFIIICLAFMALIYIFPEGEDDNGKSTQPMWLSEARTKPALNYGVKLIKSIVPEDPEEQVANALDKTRDQASEAEEKARMLQEMSIPVPSYGDDGNSEPAFYEDDARDNMNDFFDRNIQQ